MKVYTAITSNKDELIEDNCSEAAELIAFTDDLLKESKNWKLKPAPTIFKDPCRNAKAPKILSHLYIDDEYSLWIDGNIRLNVPMPVLVEKYLKDADICFFNHPLSTNCTRNCLYEEAQVCKELKLDPAKVIDEQTERYRAEGYPEKNGLYAGNVILRRHTPKIIELNNMWWSEICRGSRRDQISLNYCLSKLGIKANLFPGYHQRPYGESDYFQYNFHKNR